jgi:hypothetical protein
MCAKIALGLIAGFLALPAAAEPITLWHAFFDFELA